MSLWDLIKVIVVIVVLVVALVFIMRALADSIPQRPLSKIERDRAYESGASDVAADWDFALNDVIPVDVDATPMAVRKYIQHLQERLHHAQS